MLVQKAFPTLLLGEAISETLRETYGNNLNCPLNLQIGVGDGHQGFGYWHITGGKENVYLL